MRISCDLLFRKLVHGGWGLDTADFPWGKMATSYVRSSTGVPSEIRGEFTTKEGTYRNVRASEHCRPSRQPLFGKDLSPVQVSVVSCKDKEGLSEWIVFNSGKELYFYTFDGVGKVCCLSTHLCVCINNVPVLPYTT